MVLQSHIAALNLRACACARHDSLSHCFLNRLLRLFGADELLYAADEVLHEAQLGHILRHEV